MTGEEFQEDLNILGVSQGHFARFCEVDPNTVSRWAAQGPPAVVSKLLEILILLDVIQKKFAESKKKNHKGDQDVQG